MMMIFVYLFCFHVISFAAKNELEDIQTRKVALKIPIEPGYVKINEDNVKIVNHREDASSFGIGKVPGTSEYYFFQIPPEPEQKLRIVCRREESNSLQDTFNGLWIKNVDRKAENSNEATNPKDYSGSCSFIRVTDGIARNGNEFVYNIRGETVKLSLFYDRSKAKEKGAGPENQEDKKVEGQFDFDNLNTNGINIKLPMDPGFVRIFKKQVEIVQLEKDASLFGIGKVPGVSAHYFYWIPSRREPILRLLCRMETSISRKESFDGFWIKNVIRKEENSNEAKNPKDYCDSCSFMQVTDEIMHAANEFAYDEKSGVVKLLLFYERSKTDEDVSDSNKREVLKILQDAVSSKKENGRQEQITDKSSQRNSDISSQGVSDEATSLSRATRSSGASSLNEPGFFRGISKKKLKPGRQFELE